MGKTILMFSWQSENKRKLWTELKWNISGDRWAKIDGNVGKTLFLIGIGRLGIFIISNQIWKVFQVF